jgi:hypothetical protein
LVASEAGPAGEESSVPFSSTFLVFWVRVACVLFVGYTASVFWAIVTGVYLVVRESADGIPITQMWIAADDIEPMTVGTAEAEDEESGESGEST